MWHLDHKGKIVIEHLHNIDHDIPITMSNEVVDRLVEIVKAELDPLKVGAHGRKVDNDNSRE